MDFFINMTNGIASHFSSTDHPNAVSGVDWPRTLAALAARQNGRPLPGHLEINCHGDYGRLMLQPAVDMSNVSRFAGLIRRLMTGGLIEILACYVANWDSDLIHSIADSKRANAHYQLMLDAYEKRDWTNRGPDEVLSFVRQAIRMGRSRTFLGANGPLFCATLATLTGARVRASMYAQAEDEEVTGNRAWATTVGKWEGHVIDFMPGDAVHYAGFDLPRNVFRTHDEHGDGPLRAA